jgi:hypothetical protein
VSCGVSRQTLKRALSSPAFISGTLPVALLGLLLLVGLVTVVTQAGQYGIAEDELVQDPYGRAALAFYGALGRNRTFLTMFIPEAHMPEHGAIFEVGIAAAQYVLPSSEHWYVRHLLTALVGVVGIAVIALAGFELGGYWVAFLAGLGLWLYPRYYGSIYTNSKDIPAAITMTAVLWAALVLVRLWNDSDHPRRYLRAGVLLGAMIGLAAAIRVNALIWYVILVVFVAGWWMIQGRRIWREGLVHEEWKKQAVAAAAIGGTSLIVMTLLWPYVLLNPISNLVSAVQVISHYPWSGPVLYQGTLSGNALPCDAAPCKLYRRLDHYWIVAYMYPTRFIRPLYLKCLVGARAASTRGWRLLCLRSSSRLRRCWSFIRWCMMDCGNFFS